MSRYPGRLSMAGLALAMLHAAIPAAAEMRIAGGTAEDRAAFLEIQRVWTEAYLGGDLDRLTALHGEDAVLMPRREPTLAGLAAIREFFASRIGRYDIEFEDDPKELVINGDWAFIRGEFKFVARPRDGGEAYRDAGRYFVLYRKHDDGRWKIYRDMDNSLPARSP